MRISDALDRYIVQLEADGRSQHTVKQARRHVRLMIAAMGDAMVETIGPEDVARFLASDAVTLTMDGAPRRATSANALRSSVRCFYAFAHASGYAPVNAARMVRRARCGAPRPRGVSEADAAKLVDLLVREANDRDRLMIELMLFGGLRVGSVVALDVGDIEGDELRLRGAKGDRELVAYLPADLAERLRTFAGKRGPIFTSASGKRLTTRHVSRRLAHWSSKAGLARIPGPHALRHRFAMQLYERTGDILVVGAALGHASTASTAVYARPTAGRVREAVRGGQLLG